MSEHIPAMAPAARRSSRIARRTTSIMESYMEPNEADQIEEDRKYHPMFPHFRAMMYRKWISIKRSIWSVIANIIVTVIVSSLAIIVKILMDSIVHEKTYPYNFNTYRHQSDYVVVVGDQNNDIHKRYLDTIKTLFKSDTGRDVKLRVFENVDKANEYMYKCKDDPNWETPYVCLGVVLPDPAKWSPYGNNSITMMWNDTTSINMNDIEVVNESYVSLINTYRIELATLTTPLDLSNIPDEQVKAGVQAILAQANVSTPADLDIWFNGLPGQSKDTVFSLVAPLLIAAGLSSVISVFIVPPIVDIQGPIRSYMQSCTLTIFPYWITTFICDYIIWMIDCTVVWIVFVACDIKCFSENLGCSYWILFTSGFSFLLYIYVLSFIFTDPDNASRNAFIFNIILLILPIIISLVTIDLEDAINSLEKMRWLYWIYALFPPLLLEGYMQNVFLYYTYNTKGLSYYYESDSTAFAYSIFVWLDIIIWGVILLIIELSRDYVKRKAAKSSFGNYGDFFREQKAKHPVTPEADQMAEEVANNHDYAVRIENVSRLFFNTQGDPIPAVNCVSLGVKKGSLFGFLGANGAGKTTLINMITSMLPPSDGKIEINGKDISVENDPTLLSVCPQFNTHLCMEMTISEHFHFYSMLHQMSPAHEKRNSEKLLKLLELEDIKDIPARELSEGDARKLAIALSFLGRAKIILLDEPTATLDPVSRHQVHEMILYYKGQKTFMLCTHLLSEAEALCENISIMIKGNVYTVGSPQYLSAKFGTDYKVDLMLKDESEEVGQKVDNFFKEKIPTAVMSIKRPSARIYNVPAGDFGLGTLFKLMEEGKEGDNGISYYTCSSSSLEKVFMEIVRISESGDPEATIAA